MGSIMELMTRLFIHVSAPEYPLFSSFNETVYSMRNAMFLATFFCFNESSP
jgi:hypothetical protein